METTKTLGLVLTLAGGLIAQTPANPAPTQPPIVGNDSNGNNTTSPQNRDRDGTFDPLNPAQPAKPAVPTPPLAPTTPVTPAPPINPTVPNPTVPNPTVPPIDPSNPATNPANPNDPAKGPLPQTPVNPPVR